MSWKKSLKIFGGVNIISWNNYNIVKLKITFSAIQGEPK